MTPVPSRLHLALTLLLALGLGACVSSTDNEDGFRFAGDWCTLRTLSAAGTPVLSAAHMGGLFVQEGNRVLGSGAVKRPGESTLWPSRYVADVVGNTLLMEVTPLDGDPAAPRFALDLALEGTNDLVGTVTGDAGFAGPIRLVRLGPRCFVQ
jgi:hypothetical protein